MKNTELRHLRAYWPLFPIMGGMEDTSGGGDNSEGDQTEGDQSGGTGLGGIDLGTGSAGPADRLNVRGDTTAGLESASVQGKGMGPEGGPDTTFGSVGDIPGVGGPLSKGFGALGSFLERTLGIQPDGLTGVDPSLQVGGQEGVSREGGAAQGRAGEGTPGQGGQAGTGTAPNNPLAWLDALLAGNGNGVGAGAGAGAGAGSGAGGGAAGTGSDPVLTKLLDAYDIAIPYMQSTNLIQTPEGQAVRESVVGNIRAQYEQQKQQVLQRAAAMGLTPSSGVVQQQLADLDRQFQSDQSGVDRQFTATYYSRLNDSLSSLTNLVNLEDSRNAAALGEAMAQDATQQQDIMDLVSVVTGNTAPDLSNAAAISSGVLQYATSLGNRYLQMQQQSGAGLASLAESMAFGTPQAPATAAAPATPDYSPNMMNLMDQYFTQNPSDTGSAVLQ